MRKMWLAGAAMLAGLSGFVGAAYAQRSEGADVSADTATAGRLSPGQSVNGSLDPAGDTDWYRVRLQANRAYTLTLNGSGDNALGDPVLTIMGAEGGEPLAFNDDANDSLNSQLEFTPSTTGYFYVGAQGFFGEAVGGYTLSIDRGVAVPPPPPPVRITPGQSVEGDLSTAGERDRYSARLTAGATYRITLVKSGENPLGDPFLNIYAPNAQQPTFADDDSGGDLNSYAEFTPTTTGEYILEARGYSDDATGGYTITLREGDIPADASTDLSLNADGDMRIERLHPAADRDWYRLELAEGQIVRLRLDSGGMGDVALADPYINVYDSAGAIIAADDDGGEGLNSYLEFAPPAPGTYFVEVRGFQDGASGGYALTLMPGEIPDNAEGGEFVAANDERYSALTTPGDVDWFGINAVEGRTYRINVLGGEEGMVADPMVTLIGPDGAEIATDDDGGTGFNAFLGFTAPASGIYFAAVSAYAGEGTGQYVLRLQDNEVPGSYDTDETLAGEDDGRAGRIDFPGDKDAFRLIVQPGGSYTVTVEGMGDHALADPYVAILNQEGAEIANNDNIARRNLNASVTFTVPQDNEIAYVVVSGANGELGDYVMTNVRADSGGE